MIHMAEKVVLLIVIAALYTGFVVIRPGAKKISRRRLIGVVVVGLIIGVILLMSDNLYAPA